MDQRAHAGLRRLTLVLWAIVFWTMLVLFFASQDYVMGDVRVSLILALKWEVSRWYLWGLLAPLIAAVIAGSAAAARSAVVWRCICHWGWHGRPWR